MKYHLTPEYRYVQQMKTAEKRGIDWYFTFDSWYDLWIKSGHYEDMGNRKGQYCMARNGDTGPYSVSNVRITTVEDNHREAVKVTRQHTSIENQTRHYTHPKGKSAWNKGKSYDATPAMKQHLDAVHTANQKKVSTPQGVFDSILDAATALGVHKENARRWAHNNQKGWSLL